jgi:hypothetical protein
LTCSPGIVALLKSLSADLDAMPYSNRRFVLTRWNSRAKSKVAAALVIAEEMEAVL